MSSEDLVREYDRRYPDMEIPDAQKQERAERILFKEEQGTLRRSTRNRGIIVPRLPWVKD